MIKLELVWNCIVVGSLIDLSYTSYTIYNSILDYELLDVEIPTITIVGKLIKAGIPVLVYR